MIVWTCVCRDYLEKSIIHLNSNDAAVWINDTNLSMLNRSPSTVRQITASSGLQLICREYQK